MGKRRHCPAPPPVLHSHGFRYFLFVISAMSLVGLFYLASKPCRLGGFFLGSRQLDDPSLWSGRLDELPFAWNHLRFSASPPPRRLRIALFVKRWPKGDRAGGMERHALTLHGALALRGHATHVFTSDPGGPPDRSSPTCSSTSRRPSAAFARANAALPFDVVHSESVGLPHLFAGNLSNVAVSWHGIAYEAVHSEIAQDLARLPGEPRSSDQVKRMQERLFRVVDEVKFFDSYAHHVATSDHVGDILRRVYMIPDERVHVILNGVDEQIFRRDAEKGTAFRRRHRVPEKAKLDKGHPIMVEALRQLLEEEPDSMEWVFFLVAGDGPWGDRYRELGPNFLVLGPLDRPSLSEFYNAIDVFAHPTLRAQGLDQTVLEAMNSGKPVMVARFAGITESAIVSSEMGYVFAPSVQRIKETLSRVIRDGRGRRALKLFTATKMAAAFERLFLCIASKNAGDGLDFCRYPLSTD
ncbi:unnamed protein product [Spirodela intermedia]|uniref:Glycosyltransferase subfamily 4-like N-terminal domain-containing protein n=1 Tax=Spirodela intermedia TaxID=51605 RepID=A0A7I8IHC8_SPIIN|nr:unnamed protein product [Spirodela intermedia]CAA6656776.1 unnamed protein product [Spirodela intermedia]